MVEEKIVTINLRKKLLKTGRWRRNKTAVSRVRDMISKISKVNNVVFERKLSNKIFINPLSKVKVRIVNIDKKSVRAELVE